MSPSFRRLLPPLILTICYWPIALIFLGLSLMGDCFADRAVCEAGQRTALWAVLTVEVVIYAALLFSLIRQRTRTFWLIAIVCLVLMMGAWLPLVL